MAVFGAVLLALAVPPIVKQQQYGHAPRCAGTSEPSGSHCVVEERATLQSIDPSTGKQGSILHLRLADGTVRDNVDLYVAAPLGATAGTMVVCRLYGADVVSVTFPDGTSFQTTADPQNPYHVIDVAPVILIVAALALIPIRRVG